MDLRRPRARIRVTRRLPGMLLAALVFYVFATNSLVIWLYLLSAMMVALVLVGALAPVLVTRRVRPRVAGFTRSGFQPPLPQDRGRVFAGDRLVITVDLGQHRPPVELGPFIDATGATIPARSVVSGAEASLELPAGRRGLMELARVKLTSSWPIGIVRVERWLPVDFSLVVHPQYALPPDNRRRGTREPVGMASVRGAGDEFLGLRGYRSGDSQRRIHWPTSARTGSLMVIETAQDSSNATLYELDLRDGGPDESELAVGLAASFAAGNVAAGIPMALAVPGELRPLRRWGDALAALAVTRAGDETAGSRVRDSLRVKAGHGEVLLSRGGSTQAVDGGLSLVEALEALGENR